MNHLIVTRIAAATLGLTLAGLCGCNSMTTYVLRQGIGQLETVWSSVPIDHVLAGGKLDAEQERKLRLVVAARDFARDQLGLKVGRSFQYYHETGGQPIAYNLSAARQDALTAKSWNFPVIGTIDYLGFFDRADADQAAAELQKEGYDTFIYGVDAYSTLGWFPDPVHSSFLKRPDGSLVETVIHELAHNTVYANGQSTFNESLATFIGRRGARGFFEQQGADGAQIIAELERSYADEERITTWMMSVEQELRTFYAQQLSTAEKVAGRQAVFQAARDRFTHDVLPTLLAPDAYRGWGNLPTNNAFVLLHRRYHLDLSVFQAVYDRNAQDWPAFLDALRVAAKSDDPFYFLRQAAGGT